MSKEDADIEQQIKDLEDEEVHVEEDTKSKEKYKDESKVEDEDYWQ